MASVRTVWITGASSGIGRALAEEFASHGDTIAASARTSANLASLQSQIVSSSGTCMVFPCDITNAEQVYSSSEAIRTGLGPVDILINNAGVTYFKDFMSTTIEQFDEVMATNLRGTFLATQAVLPGMLEKGRGLILNVLSFAAKAVYTGSSAYAASKAGAEAMMNVLRAETRSRGIKIVNVYPGAVLTPIWHPKHREKYGDQMMKPDEIARMLYYVSCQPPSMVVEDIVIRPQVGDLQV
ncbi:MAG: SDR family NAD(P)-dependent oxidoreductase [Ignavibacteriales bacterium]|nr:SDR family NAD(P)-dependent oxidoreductase [Ignavibacteriales bacterium]